jgi:hypothetical protein
VWGSCENKRFYSPGSQARQKVFCGVCWGFLLVDVGWCFLEEDMFANRLDSSTKKVTVQIASKFALDLNKAH